jgi:hypothetical protein
MDRMFHAVDGDTHRVISFHESLVFDWYPTVVDDGLYIAEVLLGPDDQSLLS